jgi:hypothetical protein
MLSPSQITPVSPRKRKGKKKTERETQREIIGGSFH